MLGEIKKKIVPVRGIGDGLVIDSLAVVVVVEVVKMVAAARNIAIRELKHVIPKNHFDSKLNQIKIIS